MAMLCLYLQAPFAAFRTFTAGSFRPTAEFLTHSAAYGLLLNVAGIEMRHDDGKKPMTLIKQGLPRFRLALGALTFPQEHSVYQQLHNYPVGTSGKNHAPKTKGSKYNITPVRRALLSDLKAYVCVDGVGIESQVRKGLKGNSQRSYGLPFLGDNNFLIDRLEPVEQQPEAYWFERIMSEGSEELRERTTRLTIRIDRADMAQTQSALFAPISEPSHEIPESAWVEVGY
jgi:CRISPR-associated protein Cas5t